MWRIYKTHLVRGDTTYKNSGKERMNDMEFLKEIFKDKALTYDELVQAVNAHNGDEANKDKQIKIGNLGGGEYVGKGKFDSEIEKLTNLANGKETELGKANELIEQLKKSAKGDEEAQGKIIQYEKDIASLKEQLHESEIKSALKIAFLSEKANPDDIDYLTFKINEKLRGEGKTLELDENKNIKGIDDLMSGIKTQYPKQFEQNSGNDIDPNPLPGGDDRKIEPVSLADALKQQFENN